MPASVDPPPPDGATTHVVGAGLAGLACAVRLVGAGRRVALYEAAGHAGGRCRSFFDAALGCSIDNGNHLMLGGNQATMAYLYTIGARDGLHSAPEIVFPFVDLGTGARWTLRPNRGRLPWWILAPSRRVPGSGLGDYFAARRLAGARADQTVADVLDTARPFFERFWEPLAVAVLNAATDEGAARLLWPVVELTFGRGGEACQPFVARDSLSASLVDPAVDWLAERGAPPGFGRRLRRLESDAARVHRLDFGETAVDLGDGDGVVLAVPPARAAELLPEIVVPRESRAIVNAHFRLATPVRFPGDSPLLGVVGGHAQWIFLRGDIAAVTVSAADAMLDTPADQLAALLWADVARAIGTPDAPLPAHRIVKERRATFAQTPDEVARRPPARTGYANLWLAGDWIDTGLPATIESAVRSGHSAARLALGGD